jgi:hypothetical protein
LFRFRRFRMIADSKPWGSSSPGHLENGNR